MTKNLREQELLANRLKQLERAAFSVKGADHSSKRQGEAVDYSAKKLNI